MIVERRSYLLQPRSVQEFWAVQRDWYWPPEIGDFFNHLVGYFESAGKGPKSIVHLYRFDSLGEWEGRYKALYRRFPPDYFTVVRKLLAAQESVFMTPAPVPGLPALAPPTAPLAPAIDYDYYNKPAPTGLIVEECITDFRPGGVFAYWDALRQTAQTDLLSRNLIGMFQSTTGRLHRVYAYRWFLSIAEADDYRAAFEQTPACAEIEARSASFKVKSRRSFLKPAPFAWLRPLFETFDRRTLEALDPSLRRIGPWPPAID